ncbi:MAG: hypothetical protein JSR33_12480 [Proteobacteria bacterium]|nr:hypothetical protein [Pseudomonadota bacterium]
MDNQLERINPLQAHQERQSELTELTEQMLHSYEALKSAYQEQGEKLKELNTSVIHYKQQSSYWEWQFNQIKSRQEELEAELEELKGKLRKREKQIFGNKSEKTPSHSEQQSEEKKSLKKRGQQPENDSPARRDYPDLPEVEEVVELTDKENYCFCCGLKYQELSGTEDSEVLEIIDVQAYRRRICRKRYKRQC